MSEAVAVEPTRLVEQRKERDFSERKRPLRFMKQYDAPPAGALVWDKGDSYGMNKLLREWRKACFWRHRRELVVRTLVSLLPDCCVQSGFAWPSNEWLSNEAFVSDQKIDRALTVMDHGGSIIRVHADIGRGRAQRRIYLAKAIIDDFQKASSSKMYDATI